VCSFFKQITHASLAVCRRQLEFVRTAVHWYLRLSRLHIFLRVRYGEGGIRQLGFLGSAQVSDDDEDAYGEDDDAGGEAYNNTYGDG
jgi:hypothetical protein